MDRDQARRYIGRRVRVRLDRTWDGAVCEGKLLGIHTTGALVQLDAEPRPRIVAAWRISSGEEPMSAASEHPNYERAMASIRPESGGTGYRRCLAFTEGQVTALLWAVDAHFHATPVDAASGEMWAALKHAAAKLEEAAPWLEEAS